MAKVIYKEEWIKRKTTLKKFGDADGNITSWGSQAYCSECKNKISEINNFCPSCGTKFNGMTKNEEPEQEKEQDQLKNHMKQDPVKKSLNVSVYTSQLHEDEDTAMKYINDCIIKSVVSDLRKNKFITEEDFIDYDCNYVCYDEEENMDEYDIKLIVGVYYMDNGETEISTIKNNLEMIFNKIGLEIKKYS